MSIVNIWCEPGVALVGVDTEGVDENGARIQTSKLIPLVHCNAIVAGRGTGQFIQAIAMAGNQGDFDQVAERIRANFVTVFDSLKAMFDHLKLPLLERQEVNLVGFSPKAGRMVGLEYVQQTRAGGVAMTYQQQTIAPWHEEMTDKRAPRTLADMVWLARAQSRFLRERAPEGAGGGKLVIAEVTRLHMKIAAACELPN